MLTLARLALLITVRKLADTAVGIDTPSEKKIIALRPGRAPIAATIDKRPSVVAWPFSVCSIRSKPSAARSETPFKALSKAREAMLPMLWLVAAFASACESCWVSERRIVRARPRVSRQPLEHQRDGANSAGVESFQYASRRFWTTGRALARVRCRIRRVSSNQPKGFHLLRHAIF